MRRLGGVRAREDGSQKVGEFLTPREKRTETISSRAICWSPGSGGLTSPFVKYRHPHKHWYVLRTVVTTVVELATYVRREIYAGSEQ